MVLNVLSPRPVFQMGAMWPPSWQKSVLGTTESLDSMGLAALMSSLLPDKIIFFTI